MERCVQAGNGHFGTMVMAKSELQICVNALCLRRFGKTVGDNVTDQALNGVKKGDRAEVIHGVWTLGRVLD